MPGKEMLAIWPEDLPGSRESSRLKEQGGAFSAGCKSMRIRIAILVFLCARPLLAGDQQSLEVALPERPKRIISSAEWASLIPTEKALLEIYQNLTPEELKGLLPSERASANEKKGAAMAAAYAAALKQWCEEYPTKCDQIAKAEARTEEAEQAREEERADRQQAQRQRNQQADRDQAGQLIDRVKTAAFMGHSRDEIKTDVFLSGNGGPETQRVKNQIETNLFMGRPPLELVNKP